MAYEASCKDIQVMARVTGYFAPVKQFNKGKQEEFKERKPYHPTGGTKPYDTIAEDKNESAD
jgi:hypothetical protein